MIQPVVLLRYIIYFHPDREMFVTVIKKRIEYLQRNYKK